jgi:hypothetical protein
MLQEVIVLQGSKQCDNTIARCKDATIKYLFAVDCKDDSNNIFFVILWKDGSNILNIASCKELQGYDYHAAIKYFIHC